MKSKEMLLLKVAWLQALVASLGSLYFSEIMLLPPCKLCWYQRIVMYPLVWIMGVGIYKRDRMSAVYGLPLAVIGLLIALYHNLLYYGVIPESTAPCLLGVSCTTKFFEWFGFVTIPLLSAGAFLVITASLILVLVGKKK